MDDIARHDGACIAEKPVDYPDYVRAYTNKILAQEKKRFRLEELRQRQAVQLGRETVLTA
jgi:hypothetical protein